MVAFVFDLQRFVETVSLTSGDDQYANKDSDRIIYALGGADSIKNGTQGTMLYDSSVHNVTIYAGDGNDSVQNHVNGAVIYAGNGDDFVREC